MEKLKCVVPERLKRRVEESHIDDLPSLSSSLLQLFLSLPQFHQLISELAAEPSTQAGLCGKNEGAALDLKQKGNQCYSSGDHSQALRCYSQVSSSLLLITQTINELNFLFGGFNGKSNRRFVLLPLTPTTLARILLLLCI